MVELIAYNLNPTQMDRQILGELIRGYVNTRSYISLSRYCCSDFLLSPS